MIIYHISMDSGLKPEIYLIRTLEANVCEETFHSFTEMFISISQIMMNYK